MRRVLFVDDEPKVLDGLRRMLRDQRREWEMVFAEGGQAAMDAMRQGPFDVVVTDMRMLGMDGAQLLSHVQSSYPCTVRIVLSGSTDQDAALRALPSAHQFLTKPCSADRVREVIERACTLRDLLADESLRKLVSGIDALPVCPGVYKELTSALADPDVDLGRVSRIVEQDAAVCAKLLQIVNSSFFGLARNVSSVKDAIGYLGLKMLKTLVMAAGVFREVDESTMPVGYSLDREQAHALQVVRIAEKILEDKQQAESVLMAAMLHDIGKLILATGLPREYERVNVERQRTGRPAHEVERELIGVSHGELGGYLLGIWGLPHVIIEAVTHHHCPSRVDTRDFGVLGAVHVAQALAEMDDAPDALDVTFLQSTGRSDAINGWRDVARAVLTV